MESYYSYEARHLKSSLIPKETEIIDLALLEFRERIQRANTFVYAVILDMFREFDIVKTT